MKSDEPKLSSERKKYERPELEIYGDLRTLTQGNTHSSSDTTGLMGATKN